MNEVTPSGVATTPRGRDSLLHGFSWSLAGGLGAGGLLFAQNLLAGRILGPTQYGTFSFIQAIAMVLLIPSLAGFDLATSRALSRSESERHREKLAASSIAVVSILSLITAALVLVLSGPLAGLLEARQSVIVYGSVFTVFLAQRWLMERQLSGLGRFRQQAGVRLVEAVVTVITFVLLVTVFDIEDFRALVVAYSVGAVTMIAGAHAKNGQRLRPPLASRATVRELATYSGLMNASYLFATVIFQMDMFVVNRVLGPHELGLYSAYYTGTIFIVIQLLMIISNVLHPAMARLNDKRAFIHRVARWLPIAFLLTLLFMLFSLWAVLHVFGESYPLRTTLAIAFSGWAALYACNGTFAVIVNAHNEKSAAREVAFQPVRIAFLVAWFAGWLASSARFSLEIAVSGLIVAEVLESLNLRRIVRVHITQSNDGPDHTVGLIATRE